MTKQQFPLLMRIPDGSGSKQIVAQKKRFVNTENCNLIQITTKVGRSHRIFGSAPPGSLLYGFHDSVGQGLQLGSLVGMESGGDGQPVVQDGHVF